MKRKPYQISVPGGRRNSSGSASSVRSVRAFGGSQRPTELDFVGSSVSSSAWLSVFSAFGAAMKPVTPLQKYAVLTLRSSCPSKSADKAMVSGGIGFAAELGSVDWANAGPAQHKPMSSNRAERRNATGSPRAQP